MTLRFYRYASDAPDTEKLCHVTIEYQTAGGSPGAWGRWIYGADDLTHALAVAQRHVETFRRMGRIYGGSAAPYQGAARGAS